MWTHSFDFPLSYVWYWLLYWCAKRSNTRRVPCWRLYLRESDQITLRLSGPSVSYHGSSWNITNRLVQCISLYEEKEPTLNHIFPQTTMVYIITRILKGGYFTILHTLIESSSAKKNRQWFAFSSKFGGRPKLEEREVTPMHFSHLKIQHNWFSVKYCKEVHLLTPMLSIFDVDMHLKQREDTSHLFWILICVFSQSKEGFRASPRLLFHGNRQKVTNNKSNNNVTEMLTF